MKIVRMLYTEEVISKETLDIMEKSGGSETDILLRALSNTVSEDPNKLRIFATILLQSVETVHVGEVILKEYSKQFLLILWKSLLKFCLDEQFPQEMPVQPSPQGL